MIIAKHEILSTQNPINLDPFWLEKAWKFIFLIDDNQKKINIVSSKEFKTISFRRCLEFYTSELLSKSKSFQTSIFKVINYEGFHILSLTIDVPLKGNKLNQDIWNTIFSKIPNLKTLTLNSSYCRSGIGAIISGAVHNCVRTPEVLINILGTRILRDVYENLITLCTLPTRNLLCPLNSKHPHASYFQTNSLFRMEGNTGIKYTKETKIPVTIVKKPVSVTLTFKESSTETNFSINDLVAANLNAALNIISYLTTLDLSNVNIGYEGCNRLTTCFNTLSNSLSIQHLILPNTNITAKGMVELTESLIHISSDGIVSNSSCSKNIKTINFNSIIDSCDIYVNDYFKSIGYLLSFNFFDSISILNLSNNSCTMVGINSLLDGIEKCQSLKQLSLAFTPQIGGHLNRLAIIIKKKPICSLFISDCKLLPRQLIPFFSSLKNTNLNVLDISRNTLNCDSINSMVEWMQSSKLENLIMAGCGDQGNIACIRILLKKLASLPLKHIDISSQGIDDTFCKSISEQWSKQKMININDWNLENNLISDEGFKYLARQKKIIPNRCISLRLRGNPISIRLRPQTEYTGYLFYF
jgi:hypothetical protein